MWAKMAKTAQDRQAEGAGKPLHDAKLVTARYFMERVMPETGAHLARISAGADSMMALAEDAF